MKKIINRIICIALAAMMCIGFASCDNGDSPVVPGPDITTSTNTGTPGYPANSTNAATSAPSVHAEAYTFTYKNVKITPNAELAPIIAALGTPQGYVESPSCAFTGLDKIYTYPHFMIYSYPKDNVDYVYMVFFTDDIVGTDEGLKIGMTATDATRLYGTNYEDKFGTYYFTKGKTQISVKTEGGAVKEITYIAITE